METLFRPAFIWVTRLGPVETGSVLWAAATQLVRMQRGVGRHAAPRLATFPPTALASLGLSATVLRLRVLPAAQRALAERAAADRLPGECVASAVFAAALDSSAGATAPSCRAALPLLPELPADSIAQLVRRGKF